MGKTKYDSIICDGDRVAIAPHTDLWMAGCRFGTVVAHGTIMTSDMAISDWFRVRLDTGRIVALAGSDLLGALR